ncbi:MAG: GDP-L-fucose synthase [Candidatus Magasanikbacteria bacterium]
MDKNSKIYIAGHNGMVGSAIVRKLKTEGYNNLVVRTREELDLIDAKAVADFFVSERPDYVILAAAKVGGILANNNYPADFLYQNLQIQNNIIHNAYLSGVKKLLFLGSSCIYPKDCLQPIKEEYLMTGELEKTNEPYAIAKIAGIKMCQSYNRQYGTNFIAVMPTNLYGPNDNFDLETSHVLPALIRKFHEANINNKKQVEIWGTGRPRREFLHVDDLARACLFVLQNFDPNKKENERGEMFLNIGTGNDLTVGELAKIIKEIVGFGGKIVCDKSKPDGTMQKLLDVSKINKLGWKDEIGLKEGIKQVYEWYLNSIDT